MAEKGYVYFIEVPGQRVIKIGFSERPLARLAGLQTAHVEELALLGVIAGGLDAEQCIHEKFSHLRARGELFHATRELRAFIRSDTVAYVSPKSPPREVRFPKPVSSSPKPTLTLQPKSEPKEPRTAVYDADEERLFRVASEAWKTERICRLIAVGFPDAKIAKLQSVSLREVARIRATVHPAMLRR